MTAPTPSPSPEQTASNTEVGELVARLRAAADDWHNSDHHRMTGALNQAADLLVTQQREIEGLRAERQALRNSIIEEREDREAIFEAAITSERARAEALAKERDEAQFIVDYVRHSHALIVDMATDAFFLSKERPPGEGGGS